MVKSMSEKQLEDFCSHKAQEIADEKAQEKTLNVDRFALGRLPSSSSRSF
jgi:hypothetical protein